MDEELLCMGPQPFYAQTNKIIALLPYVFTKSRQIVDDELIHVDVFLI